MIYLVFFHVNIMCYFYGKAHYFLLSADELHLVEKCLSSKC